MNTVSLRIAELQWYLVAHRAAWYVLLEGRNAYQQGRNFDFAVSFRSAIPNSGFLCRIPLQDSGFPSTSSPLPRISPLNPTRRLDFKFPESTANICLRRVTAAGPSFRSTPIPNCYIGMATQCREG